MQLSGQIGNYALWVESRLDDMDYPATWYTSPSHYIKLNSEIRKPHADTFFILNRMHKM